MLVLFLQMDLKQALRKDIIREFSKYDNIDNVQHEIHPDVDIMYNSLNIFLGQRGSGKTFNGFNIAALISRIPSKFHLFVFVSDNPNDETFTKFKPLVSLPSVLVSYAESEKFLSELKEITISTGFLCRIRKVPIRT